MQGTNAHEFEWHQILTDGGMGDLIACLVAVDYNITHFKHVKFHVWVPDYLLEFAKHALKGRTQILPFSKAKFSFKHDILGMTTEWCTNHTCIRTHPVDYGFHMLSDRHEYDLNKKNYLQIRPTEISLRDFVLPKNYVVLAATGVEEIRTMPISTANTIIDYLKHRNYTTVFLGKESSPCGINDMAVMGKIIPIDFSKGINLINKTTIPQAAKIIHEAKAFVGMDGGLLHLAGCTDTEIVCGFTASSPVHVAPIRKGSQSHKFQAIEPDDYLENRYYQTHASFKKGNFQKFTGWEKVKESMTADKFIKALDKIL